MAGALASSRSKFARIRRLAVCRLCAVGGCIHAQAPAFASAWPPEAGERSAYVTTEFGEKDGAEANRASLYSEIGLGVGRALSVQLDVEGGRSPNDPGGAIGWSYGHWFRDGALKDWRPYATGRLLFGEALDGRGCADLGQEYRVGLARSGRVFRRDYFIDASLANRRRGVCDRDRIDLVAGASLVGQIRAEAAFFGDAGDGGRFDKARFLINYPLFGGRLGVGVQQGVADRLEEHAVVITWDATALARGWPAR